MLAVTNRIILETTKAPQFIDITQEVTEFVASSGFSNGCVVVYSKHTTAAVKINENEPLLMKDMERFLDRIASSEDYYHHNDFTLRTVNMTEDECPNGHAHCQHLTLSTSESIPIVGGKLQLGTYQRVFFIELDCPRSRETTVQVMGV